MHMPSVGSPPSYAPVAIFVGGTSGIGQVMAEAFARYTKGNAHIVIVGRNRAFAESIIENLPKPTVPNVTHEFVQCEATLMRNVHATTTELLSRVPKINFLIMSPGALSTRGRDETEEGIDKQLAVHYYARWMFTNGLMPALLEAKNAGEDVKVFSVLAAVEGREELDGPGPEKKFIFKNAGLTAITYDDLLMEVTVFIVEKTSLNLFPHQKFATQNPGIAFTHAHQGLVRTSMLGSSDSESSVVRAVSSLLYFEHMLFDLLDGERMRSGGDPKAGERLWEDTVESNKV